MSCRIPDSAPAPQGWRRSRRIVWGCCMTLDASACWWRGRTTTAAYWKRRIATACPCWNWSGNYLTWITARWADSSWGNGNFQRNSRWSQAITTIRRRNRENWTICLLHMWAARCADLLGYWAARPLAPIPLEELLALLPKGVRDRFPADAAALTELIERSVTGGTEALNDPAKEFSTGQRQTQPAAVAGHSPDGTTPPITRDTEMLFRSPEIRPLAWDFMIVLASIMTFLFVLAVLLYFVR